MERTSLKHAWNKVRMSCRAPVVFFGQIEIDLAFFHLKNHSRSLLQSQAPTDPVALNRSSLTIIYFVSNWAVLHLSVKAIYCAIPTFHAWRHLALAIPHADHSNLVHLRLSRVELESSLFKLLLEPSQALADPSRAQAESLTWTELFWAKFESFWAKFESFWTEFE